jgi:hypothetical protein
MSKHKPKKLTLAKESLRNVTGAGPLPPGGPILVSRLDTCQSRCNCSNFNSCGAGCQMTQLGPSCGFGASVCFCPTQAICPSAVC